jgi:hypothetical protein
MAEFNERLERLRDHMMARAHARFFSIQKESPAWMAMRGEVLRMIESGMPLQSPHPQVLVNGKTFDAAIAWFINSIVLVGQLSPRNIQAAALAVMLSRGHLDLTELGTPSANLMFEGKGGVGKSHIWKLVSTLMLPGTFITLAHMSKQAFLNGENYSFYLLIQDEMSASIFIDPLDSASAAKLPRGAGNVGDSEKNSIFKQIITDRLVTIAVTNLDKQTGERKTTYYHSLCILQFFVATNISSELVSQSMNRRFYHVEFEQPGSNESAPQSQFRPKNLDAIASEFVNARRMHLLNHAVTGYLTFYINCGVQMCDLPDEVCGVFIVNKVFESLVEDFHVPSSQLSGTQHTQIRQIARAVRLFHLVFQATSLEIGLALADDPLQPVSPFSTTMFKRLWRDQLAVTEVETAWAISLCASQLVKDYERKIDMVLLGMMHQSLQVYAHELVGPHQQLVDLGLRPPPTGLGGTVNAVNSNGNGGMALGGGGGGGGGGGEGGGGGGDQNRIVIDDRYLSTEPFESLDKLGTEVSQRMQDTFNQAVRPETITMNIKARCGLRVWSPYYIPREGGGITVVTMTRTARGTLANQLPADYVKLGFEERAVYDAMIPRAEIPCIRWQAEPTQAKKRRHVLAIARSYLVPRHGMATTDYDSVRLEERFHSQYPGASVAVFDLFKKRMTQTAHERMRPPSIGVSTIVKPEWIRMHAETDMLQNLVMAALCKTLRSARLDQWPGAVDQTGTTRPAHTYLVFTQPSSVRVVEDAEADDAPGGPIMTGAPGLSTIVHFHTLMQQLVVQPSPHASEALQMVNTQRPTHTSSLQMTAAAPLSGDTVGRALEKSYADAAGMTLNVHPAMLQLWMLHEQMGEPKNEHLQLVGRVAGILTNPHDHWAHPLNVDAISVCLRRMLRDHTTRAGWTRPHTVVYPYDDMVKIINAAVSQRQNRIQGGSLGFPDMTRVLLHKSRDWRAAIVPVSTPGPAPVIEEEGGEAVPAEDQGDAMDLDVEC